MLLNSHISAYARCLAEKVCRLVRSIWGTSPGEDKLGARDKILNTKVARRACAGRAPGKHPPNASQTAVRKPPNNKNNNNSSRILFYQVSGLLGLLGLTGSCAVVVAVVALTVRSNSALHLHPPSFPLRFEGMCR